MINIIEIHTRLGGDNEGITVIWERASFNCKGELFIERTSEEFSIWFPKKILIRCLRIADCFRKREIVK